MGPGEKSEGRSTRRWRLRDEDQLSIVELRPGNYSIDNICRLISTRGSGKEKVTVCIVTFLYQG